MIRFDRGPLQKPTRKGSALVVEGFAARTHDPKDPLRYEHGDEYRDARELAALAKQLEGLPVTLGHPPGLLKSGAKGQIVGRVDSVWLDGDRIGVRLSITDARAAREIEAGTRELSLGYATRVDEHGYQRDSEADHLAIVEQARCGSTCSLRTDTRMDCSSTCSCRKEGLRPMRMTRDRYRQIAAYARARYDGTTAKLFDASADAGSMLDVYTPAMRPWLVAVLVKLGVPYTAEELATKEDAFLLGYLAAKLSTEMGPAPVPIDERPEATADDRDEARANLSKGSNETDEQFQRRVDYQARVTATQRASAQRETPLAQREHDPLREHADEHWKATLREGARQARDGID